MTKTDIATTLAVGAFFFLFVGIPTDDGLYFGYFWKLALWLSEVM